MEKNMFQTTNQMSVGMTLPTHLGLPPLEASGKKTSQCWGSGTIFSTLLALETDRLRLDQFHGYPPASKRGNGTSSIYS